VAYTRKDYPEYHEALLAMFEKVAKKPRITEEHDSATSLIAAVEAGCGLALVPQALACSAGPRLKLIPIVPEPDPLVIGAIWRKDNLTSSADQFLKAAKAAVV
jgi:LysR family transcriptional regulator, benzoate and cis,cis-muconate-responsive activator of ben and cat genes